MQTCSFYVTKTKMKNMGNFSTLICFVGILNLICVYLINGEKILALSFYSTKSHKLTYMPILKELGKRGHNVTILTPIKPLSSKPVANVTEILTLELDKFQSIIFKNFNPYEKSTIGPSILSIYPFHRTNLLVDLCQKTYDLPQVQQVMKEQFDLIIFQPVSNECAWGMIYRMKAPVIIWFPIGVAGFVANKIGGHFPPSLHPHLFMTGYSKEMSFTWRFLNFGYTILHELMQRYYHEYKMEQVYWEKLGDDIPRVHEICAEQTAMILSNGLFSLHGAKPYYPDIVDVGGIHSRPAKALPRELEDFINIGKDNGFIYFSFGTALKGSEMPKEKRSIFLKVFSKLKQQVIWKWETEEMEEELPKNVKLSKWLPQQDILGHERIKMFITHCGGGGTEEAIYHGSPLLGIPMFSDQPQNARLAQELGILVYLDWNELTEESLMTAVEEILSNSKYDENVKRLSTIMKDQPDHPLDRAVYWTEYVMRHKGTHHLRNEGRKMNFFQYHSYDVILCYLSVASLTLFAVYKVLGFLRVFLVFYLFQRNEQILNQKSK